MKKECDHTSVGVIVQDREGRYALLNRARFPIAIAPPAGHIDDHGSPEQAAKDEVYEELGISLNGLSRTAIHKRRVDNPCRREGGTYHTWSVFQAFVTDTALRPSADETKGAAWYAGDEVQALAERTRAYQRAEISEDAWAANPGLEEVWLSFMQELGYVV